MNQPSRRVGRRAPVLVIALVAIASLVVVARAAPPAATATFSPQRTGWMPAASTGVELTDTWFCPGVPATGDEGVGGELVLGNRGDVELTARLGWLGEPGASIDETVT
ncbi:MAG: hypothetical protein WD225_10675, partial [Ilumatobacteraceae bacterium]